MAKSICVRTIYENSRKSERKVSGFVLPNDETFE